MIRRTASVLVGTLIVAVVITLAYWAGTNAIAPPTLPTEEHPAQTYAVEMGAVERTARVAVAAAWPTVRVVTAGADGVVTSVSHTDGDVASSGEVLATVDLGPVVVAEGSVPMFRELRRGSRGPDVRQLQRLLRDLGFRPGRADGRFGPGTEAATRRWQRSIGAPRTGRVDPRSLLFLDGLPARLEILPRVGDRVSAGSDLVRVLGERPAFRATVSAAQRAELTTGMTVAITAPDGSTWTGTLGPFEPLDDGRFRVAIEGDVCGDSCAQIAIVDETALAGLVELVPRTVGPIVPVSALAEQPTGTLAVTLADGALLPVSVVAEADGFAVVKGIDPGTSIRLPDLPGS